MQKRDAAIRATIVLTNKVLDFSICVTSKNCTLDVAWVVSLPGNGLNV